MQSLEDSIHDALSNLRVARALYEHYDVHADPNNGRHTAQLKAMRQRVEVLNSELNALLDHMRELRQR